MTSNRLDTRARAKTVACIIALCAVSGFSAGCAPTAGERVETGAGNDVEPSTDDSPGDSQASDDDEPPPVSSKADAGPKKTGTADSGAKSAEKDTPSAAAPDGGAASDGYCKVKPIVEKYCVLCHTDDGAAPMPLVTAADFLKDAPKTTGKKVYEVSKIRINDAQNPMPPRQKLAADELALLNAWLDAKAPAGGDCASTPTTTPPDDLGRVDGWNPEECDQIYEIRSHGPGGNDTPYTVAAGRELNTNISIDAPWGNEKVQAIGFRPITDNKKVLHHWILNGAGRSFLAGWAPGDEGRPPFPKDVGMDMPTGAGALGLNLHYYNSGAGAKAESDRSGVEVCVLKGKNMRPKLAAVATSLTSLGQGGVLAPRNSKRAPVTSTCTVSAREPVHLLTAAPHAHKYAVHMTFKVKKKGGPEIVMHDQPFAFGEQGTYPVPGGDLVVESGDVITTTCYYTNDTNKDIRFGESTENEMCFNFALYYPKGGFSCGGLGGGGLPF